jgi:4-alpha-glucanotransferase
MKLERSAGLLLHPTSLPGRFGIGEINEMAYRWVDKRFQPLLATRCSLTWPAWPTRAIFRMRP